MIKRDHDDDDDDDARVGCPLNGVRAHSAAQIPAPNRRWLLLVLLFGRSYGEWPFNWIPGRLPRSRSQGSERERASGQLGCRLESRAYYVNRWRPWPKLARRGPAFALFSARAADQSQSEAVIYGLELEHSSC